jgi:hypothetical protein
MMIVASREASSVAEDPCRRGCIGRACRVSIGPSRASPGTVSCLDFHSHHFHFLMIDPISSAEVNGVLYCDVHCHVTALQTLNDIFNLPLKLFANHHSTTQCWRQTRILNFLPLASLARVCLYQRHGDGILSIKPWLER